MYIHTIRRPMLLMAALMLFAATLLCSGCQNQHPASKPSAQPTPSRPTASDTPAPRPTTMPAPRPTTTPAPSHAVTTSTYPAETFYTPTAASLTLVNWTYDPSNGTHDLGGVYRYKQ